MNKITESDIELFTIEELEKLGYLYLHGPDISIDGLFQERASYGDIILSGRPRTAVQRLNPRYSCRCARTGRFKKALSNFPEHRKKWFALNAGAMKKTITEWLESIGIKPEQRYY